MKLFKLNLYLSKLENDSVTFTLDELDILLEGKLPTCARTHPHANFANSNRNFYSKAWMSLGFLAKYSKNTNSVTFYRGSIENHKLQQRNERQYGNAQEMSGTLLIKNFCGSFNENGVGHEIINSFAPNNNKYDFYPFYVPPYGSIGNETIKFLKNREYLSIKKILIFDSTTITNILKLKAIIIDPIFIESEDEMKMLANSFKYGPNNISLTNIDFNDNCLQADKDEEERTILFPFTYKAQKNKYFNLERENLFIWHSRTEATNNLKEDSIRKFHIVYGAHTDLTILSDTRLGEKNYSYNLGDDLECWFAKKVQPLLNQAHIWRLEPVPNQLNIRFAYNKNNFLEFVKKLTDENLFTNFICSVLNANLELQQRFFAYLIYEYFEVDSYVPSNLVIEAQCQSLVAPKKCANEYLKALRNNKTNKALKLKNKLLNKYHMTENQIDELSIFIDGQMDLYLHDDNYRIAIENKILSGINGKHDDIDEDINQLRTYKTFLNDLNHYNLDGGVKINKVILLTPKNIANNFVNYDSEVPVMSYRDLALFFENNQHLIQEKYRSDFLNALYKHAVTKEEDITIRFFNSLNLNH